MANGATVRTVVVRIASWNVESIRAHCDQVTSWMDTNEPDVVCMQETKANDRTFPTQDFERRGYRLVVHGGDGGRGGVAMASRLPLSDIVLGFPGAVAPLDEPRTIAATVGGVRLHTVYAPNGRKVGTAHHEIKLAWFALFAARLEIERSEVETSTGHVVLGDFNIAPEDVDVWDASRYRKRNLTSPREREAFAQLLAAGALVDAVRARWGEQPVFTWWNRRSDFYETDRGWRLDHVLVSPDVNARIAELAIDRAERGRPGSTDHAPLLVTLDDLPA